MNGDSKITIQGSGFSTILDNMTVTINNNTCDIFETSNTSVKCMIPRSEAAGDFDLIITTTNTQAIPNETNTITTTFT